MRAASRVASPLPGLNYGGKLKIMNFTVLPSPVYQWSLMWSSSYSAARNLQWLQTIKIAGFNAVRIFTFNLPDDDATINTLTNNQWPSVSLFRTRAAEFAQQCRSLGLSIVVTLGGDSTELAGRNGDRMDANITATLQFMSVWEEIAPDLVIYYDLLNEMNVLSVGNANPTTWAASTNAARSDLFKYVRLARATTRKPLTISVYVGSASALVNNPWIDIQYDLSLDFHSIHTYYSGTTYATSADFIAFEARAKFLGRYVVDEFGPNQTFSTAQAAALMNAVGDIARRPRCLGLGMWCITPQDASASNDWGYCSDTAGGDRSP